MNSLNAGVDAARQAMTAAGQLPRGLVPNRERIETDQFSGEIYFNNAHRKPEWVAKVVFKTAEDSGRIEMVRAASKDELMVELLRQVGKLEAQARDLSAPPRSKVQVRLADYDNDAEAMFEDVLCSASTRQWLETPVGQQYARLEDVCGNTRVFEIFKKAMEELNFWHDPALWTIVNLNHAFILGFDRNDYKYFEAKADRREAQAAEAASRDAEANAPEFQHDAQSPYLHRNNLSETAQADEVKADRALPLSELRRKAYAERFANRNR